MAGYGIVNMSIIGVAIIIVVAIRVIISLEAIRNEYDFGWW